MKLSASNLLSVALCTLLCNAASGAALDNDLTNPLDERLSGSIRSFDFEGPPGDKCETSNTDEWVPIPDWLSGTWYASNEVLLYAYDHQNQRRCLEEPVTINSSKLTTFGSQRTRDGVVWHFIGTPHVRTRKTDSYNEFQQIEKVNILKRGANKLVVRCLATVTRVNRMNSTWFDRFTQETVATYIPVESDLIMVTFAVCNSDQMGKPLRSAVNICMEKKVKGFVSVNADDRGNLKAKFEKFRREKKLDK